ncbi:hypothetical protein [Rhodoferax fermentans]|uniref:Uncharacterized protein n=1 Tax=Rhodoferax fermentans TaxID=28066 RepID=A0A1T1AVN8_RHOFE|nr:hypothetical protein [Rhodoferax fermentans]MBK1685184.1 hypothetical protein [Rhodoferax fermentans]OOV08182.1 hypothetical protein RF819_16955 [Rhodoferax fermentans]
MHATPERKVFDNLGRDQIIAAIVGGHDVFAAYCEIFEPLNPIGSFMSFFGAWHCLQQCIEALSRAGLLPQLPDPHYNDFIHGSKSDRYATAERCAKADDIQELVALAGVMAACIEPYKSRFRFNNRAPYLTC